MISSRPGLLFKPRVMRVLNGILLAALLASAATQASSVTVDLVSANGDATVDLSQIYHSSPELLSLSVALSAEEAVTLELKAYNPFAPGRRMFLDGEVLDPSTYGGESRFFRGQVAGEPGSYALLEIAEDGESSLHVARTTLEYQGQTEGGAFVIRSVDTARDRAAIDWPATDVDEVPDLEVAGNVVTADAQSLSGSSGAGARSASVPTTTGLYGPWVITVPAGQAYVGVVNRGPGIANTYVVPAGESFNAPYCEYSKCYIANPAAGDYHVYAYKFDSSNGGLDYPTTINFNFAESLAADQLYAATLAIDLDDALFAQFGSSPANVNTYLAQLVSYVSTTYELELSTRLLVGDVFTYSSDPYPNTTSTLNRLNEMKAYWRANYQSTQRAVAAHLGQISTFAGGIASLDQLCDSSHGYSVSGVYGSAPTNPSQISWDAEVLAHELGHNVRSEHTHCYNGLEGNSNPVDGCYNGESGNGCWAGSESLPGVGALTGGSAGSQNGTIMSYCHLLSGGQNNLARTFGSDHVYGIEPARVPQRMSRRIAQTGAASGECLAVVGPNQNTFTVTPSASGGGSIDPSSAQTVNEGDTVQFAVTPNSGYQISGISGTCPAGSLSGNTYTTGAITANCTVVAGFEQIPVTTPGTPTISQSEVDDGEIYLYVTGDNGGLPILEYQASCTDGANTYTGSSGSSPVTVSGLTNGVSYQCQVRMRNSLGWSGYSSYSAGIVPEEATSGLPIWLLYQATQNQPPPVTCDDTNDTDGDRLLNCYETNTGTYVSATNTGTDPSNSDTDSDGISDGDEVLGTLGGLRLNKMGANPLKKTILIEYDWLSDDTQDWQSNNPWPDNAPHNHRPSTAVIDEVEAVFAAAPVNNPDGSTGIQIIQDYGQGGAFTGGNEIADDDGNLAGYLGTDFYDKKALNFASNRNGYFHYTIMSHKYGGGATESSGLAELYGDDLIVSSNWWFEYDLYVASTIVHELGHNLGLRHGGNENLNNKPNYNSVMNYNYQFPGVDLDCSGCGEDCSGGGAYLTGDGLIDYSSGSNSSLNENALTESFGVCSNQATDWNRNGSIDGGTVSYNINPDYDTSLNTLNDYDDWANIYYLGPLDADGATMSSVVEKVQCDNVPPRP